MRTFKLIAPALLITAGFAAMPTHAIELSDIVDQNRDGWDRDNNNYSWRTYHGSLPSDAVAGGREPGRTLYICQARYMDGIHPGKLVDGRCNITWGGVEVQQRNFRVLVGDGLRWRFVSNGRIPRAAIAGGGERGRPLYICQARYAGGIHPGKVFNGDCHIGYNGRDIAKQDFRVLVPGRGNDDWNDFDDRYDDNGIGAKPGSGIGSPAPGMGATPPK